MNHISSVTQKGQVTIPIDFRHVLEIGPKDRVKFIRENNRIIIQKHNEPVEALFGMYTVKHHVSDADIKRGIIKGATRGYRR